MLHKTDTFGTNYILESRVKPWGSVPQWEDQRTKAKLVIRMVPTSPP